MISSTLEELKLQLADIKEYHQQEMILMREKENVRFETERVIFLKGLREKDE